MLKTRDKWRGREALHHARRLPGIWDDQRSARGDWSAFRRRQVFRLDYKASAQLLIGITGGIGCYGLLGRAALLSSGRGTHLPENRYSRYDNANVVLHGVLPVLPSRDGPPSRPGKRARIGASQWIQPPQRRLVSVAARPQATRFH